MKITAGISFRYFFYDNIEIYDIIGQATMVRQIFIIYKMYGYN